MKRVAVIGGGLGGMTAAAELAHQGCEVSLFEAAPTLGGKAQVVRDGSVVLDTGPTLLTLPQVIRETFERIGAADLVPPLTALSHQAEYIYGDGCRFSVHDDLEATQASAFALRPGEDKAIAEFYREAEAIYVAAGEPYLEAPYEGVASFMTRVMRRGAKAQASRKTLSTLWRMAERIFKTDHLRQFAGRFATYAGASPFRASAAFALIPHIERAYGVHHVHGGMGALAAALQSALNRLGVRIYTRTSVNWSNEGKQFRVGPDREGDLFDAVVVNQDPLLAENKAQRPLALSGYVFHLKVNRRVSIPHHTVLFSDDYRGEFDALFAGRIPQAPTVYVCHPAATDPSVAGPEESGLFVMVNAPALPSGEPESTSKALWAREGSRLQAVAIDMIKAHFPDFRAASYQVFAERTPLDLQALGGPRGSIYGYLPHGALGTFLRPKIRGPKRGIFYAGGGTHPGGGVPMVMLSGHFAAHLAAQHLRLSP